MNTKKAYVIGTRVNNSLSPLIFNHWFEKYGVNARYSHKAIKEKNFNKDINKILEEDNLCGINVTIPFKEKIIKNIHKLDRHSKIIGAVNCVTKTKTKILGSNTDWLGFQNSILWLENEKGWSKTKIKKVSAIVIGYGGSAKAILYALEKLGYSNVVLWNRSFEKIKNLTKIGALRIIPIKLKKNNFIIDLSANLVINTIPTKDYYTRIEQDVSNIYKKRICGYDLVYNTQTNFLDLFTSSDRINGINLLIHQAAPCFEAWFNIKPKIDKGLFDLLYQKLRVIK